MFLQKIQKLFGARSLKYLFIAAFNFLFGYFSLVLLYFCLRNMLPAFLIALIASVIAIFVTVVSYHLLFFGGTGRFLSKLLKGYLSYGTVSIIGAFLFANLVEFMNVWLAQAVTLAVTFCFSTLGNFFFVFRKGNEEH